MVRAGTTDVVTFRNLRGDAKLVSPCRGGASVAYAHLANFVRLAPRDQVEYTNGVQNRSVRRRVVVVA